MSLNTVKSINKADSKPLVAFPYVGDSLGGSHISSLILASNLDQSRYRPLIILHEKGPLSDYISKNHFNLDIKYVPLPGYVGATHWPLSFSPLIRTFWPLVDFIRENNISLIHTNDNRMHQTWALASKFTGTKTIRHHRSPNFGIKISPIDHALASIPENILCVSHFSQSRISTGYQKKAKVIYNPFQSPETLPDVKQKRKKLLQQLNLNEKGKIIGFFGNIDERKKPDVVVKILARLNRQSPEGFGAAFFGADRNNFTLKVIEMAENKNQMRNVYLAGFQAPIEPWIAACDVVLLPGIDEPLGRVLIESMLVGTPVIAADSGGNPEIIENGKTGFLINPEDIDKFTKSVIELTQKENLHSEISQAAKASALERFAINSHVTSVMSVYDEVLNISQGVSSE